MLHTHVVMLQESTPCNTHPLASEFTPFSVAADGNCEIYTMAYIISEGAVRAHVCEWVSTHSRESSKKEGDFSTMLRAVVLCVYMTLSFSLSRSLASSPKRNLWVQFSERVSLSLAFIWGLLSGDDAFYRFYRWIILSDSVYHLN